MCIEVQHIAHAYRVPLKSQLHQHHKTSQKTRQEREREKLRKREREWEREDRLRKWEREWEREDRLRKREREREGSLWREKEVEQLKKFKKNLKIQQIQPNNFYSYYIIVYYTYIFILSTGFLYSFSVCHIITGQEWNSFIICCRIMSAAVKQKP